MGVQLTQEMIKGAQLTEEKYGVPASITLGQILLESGGSYAGGLSGLAYKGKNLFGMKGEGTAGSIYLTTKEQGSNGTYATTAKFRKYNSFTESIEDHGKLLSSVRYQQKTNSATTIREYAGALQSAGYATDKNYADKLMNVILTNNLIQYDGTALADNQKSIDNTTDNDETKLDIFGQVVRFILIFGLVILAVVFFMKGVGIENPIPVL